MADKCIHYWQIEMPNGATSQGVCKYCMAQKEFRNFNIDSYNNDGSWQKQHNAAWINSNRGGTKWATFMER